MKKQLSILLVAFGCSIASFGAATAEKNVWKNANDSERLELIYQRIKERGPKVNNLLAAAQILEKQKKKAQALELIEQAVPLATSSEQMRMCGQSYVRLGLFGKARQLFDKGVRMDPKNPGPYIDLCHLDQEIQDYPAALIAINQALKLDPGSSEALYHRANVFMSMARFQEAKQDLDQMKSQKQPMDGNFHLTFGMVNLKLNNDEEAEKNLRRAVRHNPNSQMPHQLLASIYERQQRWNDAFHELDVCLAMQANDSDSAPILIRRSNCLRNLDLDLDSLLDATRAIKLEPRAAYYSYRGEQLDGQGRTKAAIRDFTRAIDSGIEDRAKVLKMRSDCYRKLNDNEHALLDLNASIKLRPDADVFHRRFKVLRLIGRNEEALRDIEDAIKLKSNNAEFYLLRGTALSDAGQYQKALKDFELASSLDPNDERITNARNAMYHALNTSKKKQQ